MRLMWNCKVSDYWGVFSYYIGVSGVDSFIISSNFYLSRWVGWVLSKDHRDPSLLYEHELFSCSSKKSSTERLHDKWHFCYVVVSVSSLKTNQTTYLYGQRYWLNVQYVVCVYMSDLFKTGQYYTMSMILSVVYKK